MLRRIKAFLFTTAFFTIGFVVLALAPAREAFALDVTVCRHGCQYTTIQQAIDNAQSGDTIHIREGFYLENLVITNKSLTLKGENKRETIIHGTNGAAVLTLTCPNEHVAIHIADVTITGGITDAYSPDHLGGGISSQSCGLFIQHSNIQGNSAFFDGGGINAVGGKLVVEHSSVSNNTASSGGGISSTGELVVRESIVSNNEAIEGHSAKGGGGILNRGDGLIKDTVVTNNKIDCCRGSGISNAGTLQLINSTVVNNTGSAGVDNGGNAVIRESLIAGNKGGFGGGGGLSSGGSNVLSVIDSFIVDNRAREGGGIFLFGGTLILVKSTVADNTGENGRGGGILTLTGTNTLLRKSLITKNAATVGGGIFNDGGAVTSQNTTIVDNSPNNCVGVSFSCP